MSDPPAASAPGEVHAPSSRLGKVARGGVLMLGGSGVEAVFGYALALVAARLLGKHDFGLLNIGWQAITLAVIVSELGVPMAVMRYVAVHDGENDAAGAKGAAFSGTAFAGALGVLIALVLAVGARTVAERFFHKPDLAPILPIMALQLPIVAVSVTLLRVTQARGTMRYRVLVEKLLLPASRLLFIGLLVGLGFGLKGAAWGSTLACLTCLAAAAYFTAALARRAWGAARPRWRELFRVLAYAVPLVLSAVALFGRRRGIILALGISGTAGDVGLYAAAERTALAGAMGLNAIGSIFSPIAADLYHRKQHAELHGILKTSAAWIVMVVLPGAVFLAFFASEVMGTFGKDFPAGYVALAILAAAQIVNCTFGSVDYLFAMAAKQWIAVIDLSVFALASMGLTFWLAPRYGVVGAAVAGAIGLLGPRATRVVEVAVLMRMNPFGAGHLRIAACVIPSALLALVWREVFAGVVPAHAFWWLFAPAYVVLYLALLPVLAREELNGLLSVVRRRRRRGAPTEEPQPAPDELPPPSTSPSADEDVAD